MYSLTCVAIVTYEFGISEYKFFGNYEIQMFKTIYSYRLRSDLDNITGGSGDTVPEMVGKIVNFKLKIKYKSEISVPL